MKSNQAIFNLPAGFGFTVSATSDAGAHNFAEISFERDGEVTKLGLVNPGQSRNFRALFTDANIIVAGFAGDYSPSAMRVYPDPGVEYPVAVYYNDTYGGDSDFDDLIVNIIRFKVLSLSGAEGFYKNNKIDPIGVHSLDYLGAHFKLSEAIEFVNNLDNGCEVTAADYSSLPELVASLNDQEKALYNQDPIVGTRVLFEAREAVNICSTLYSNVSLHNGNGDAFRHFYWNFRMCRNGGIGEVWAERWASAHESDIGNPVLEKTMDLFNNAKGRSFAATDVDDVPSDLRAVLRVGGCRIISNGALVKSDSSDEI